MLCQEVRLGREDWSKASIGWEFKFVRKSIPTETFKKDFYSLLVPAPPEYIRCLWLLSHLQHSASTKGHLCSPLSLCSCMTFRVFSRSFSSHTGRALHVCVRAHFSFHHLRSHNSPVPNGFCIQTQEWHLLCFCTFDYLSQFQSFGLLSAQGQGHFCFVSSELDRKYF